MKNNHPFWFAAAALAALLWLPHLFSLGMFMDGVYDALLAENLYLGISTFWQPQATSYAQPAYWDNPPLSMWTLSQFYSVFGNHYATERFYSLVCALVQFGLIGLMWKIFFYKDEIAGQYAWLPCLLWLISPLIGWSYSNNLMENTMSLFTTSAIIVSIHYVQSGKQLLATSVGVAVLLLLAFITKGPVSLFPLALPVVFVGVNASFNFRKAVTFSALQTILLVFLLVVLLSFDGPNLFFSNYFEMQLKRALVHDMPEAYKPYSIFIDMVIALSPFLLLSALLIFIKNKSSISSSWWRFILLGLCGSVPIMLSVKQRKFYLLPAMIPFVMGFAMLLLPLAVMVKNKLTENVSRMMTALGTVFIALSIYLCIYNRGVVIRDKAMLSDLEQVHLLTGSEKVIRADWFFYSEWHLQGYLKRLYGKKICMPTDNAVTQYYLTKASEHGGVLPGSAQKIFEGQTLDLHLLP